MDDVSPQDFAMPTSSERLGITLSYCRAISAARNPALRASHKAVLWALAMRFWRSPECWPSNETLRDDAGLSGGALFYTLADLTEWRMVTRMPPRKGRPSVTYQINLDRLATLDPLTPSPKRTRQPISTQEEPEEQVPPTHRSSTGENSQITSRLSPAERPVQKLNFGLSAGENEEVQEETKKDSPPLPRARPKPARPPPPLPDGTPPEITAVVEELRKHPVVCRASLNASRGAKAAALELAGAIEGRRMGKGTPIAKIIEAIGEAACILAAECAGGETPQWPTVAAMIMKYVIQTGIPRGGKAGGKGQGRPLDRSTSQSAGKSWKSLPQGLTRAEMTVEERATFDAMPEEKRIEYMRHVTPGDPAP